MVTQDHAKAGEDTVQREIGGIDHHCRRTCRCHRSGRVLTRSRILVPPSGAILDPCQDVLGDAHQLAFLVDHLDVAARGREFTTLEAVRQLRAELKDITRASTVSDRVSDVLEDVREELREILEDFRFARSRRGRFVLFCNGWAPDVYRTVRSPSRFDDAYVGVHARREAVVVAGHVPDAAALHDLRAIIEAHPPGVEVVWKVAVGRQG